MIGAGQPQLVGQMGQTKSYAERLFEFVPVGALPYADAELALSAPAKKFNVHFEKDAFEETFKQTHGYPYFLQEWGKHSWQCAKSSPIRLRDVQAATEQALAELDESFFRVRLDRLTPSERKLPFSHGCHGPGASSLERHRHPVEPRSANRRANESKVN